MSAAMFGEFCLPELVELSQTFGGLGMHCCAHAQHPFAGFRRIPGFYAFNRVATGVGWEGDNALEELGGPRGPGHGAGVGLAGMRQDPPAKGSGRHPLYLQFRCLRRRGRRRALAGRGAAGGGGAVRR